MIIMAVAFGGVTLIATAAAARGMALERRYARLNRPLDDIPARALSGLRWRTDMSASVATATVLDVGVALARIDPQVLDAIDLAHGAQAFADFDTLAAHVCEVASRGDGALAGLVSQYKGSLGELMAAEHLENAGHAVEFADAPNQAGWDLLVDGQPWQIKSGLDAGGISDGQAAYPDTPIATVQEHSDLAAGADDVVALPISGEGLTHTTAETVEGIEGLGNLGVELPVVTLLLEGKRNFDAVARGEMDYADALGRTAAITAGVAAGAKAGALVGSVVPVVGTLIGSILGAIVGRAITEEALRPSNAQTRRLGHQQSSSARHSREDRKRALAKRYAKAAAPLEDALRFAWRSWGQVAALSAQASAKRAWAARTRRVERRLFDRIYPRRSVIIAKAARERFGIEARAYEAVATRFEGVTDIAALRRIWAEALPILPGLADIEAEIDRLTARLKTIAASYNQHGSMWWHGARGPREIVIAETPAPVSEAGWVGWSYAALVAGLGTALFVSMAMTAKPVGAAQRDDPTAAAPAVSARPTLEPSASTAQVRSNGCRIRRAASLTAPILKTVRAGTACQVESRNGAWRQVRCGDRRGFMHRQCLRASDKQ